MLDNRPFDPSENSINFVEYADTDTKFNYTFFSQNCRSLLANGHKLKEVIEDTNPVVVCIQECWRSSTQFPGYTMNKHERPFPLKGGGVCILTKIEEQYETIENHFSKNFEYCSSGNKRYIILNIYRPPNGKIQEYLTEFRAILNKLKTMQKNRSLFIMGDFNVNFDKSKSHESIHTKAIIDDFELMELIHAPTRITSETQTRIDNIFTDYGGEITSGIYATQISDHLGPFCSLDNIAQLASNTPSTYVDTSPKNIENFRSLLRSFNWNLLEYMPPVEAFSKFKEVFTEYFEITCPSITKSGKLVKKNP